MPKPFDSPEMWVKCDMIATVSSERLHLIRAGRGSDGKRKYLEIKVLDKDLQGIRNGIRYALGLIDS